MRILHVASEYPPQKVFGLGRYVSGLCRELARQNQEVHVLTNSIGGAERDSLDGGVTVHRVEFPPPPEPPTPSAPLLAFNLHLQQRAYSLGRHGLGNPEVIVSHDWLTAIAGHRIAKRLGVPHVWTVHDTVHGKRFGRIDGIEDTITHNIEQWAAREASLILVNSIAIAEEMRSVYGANPERISLLHPGIDVEQRINPETTRLEALRSVLARPEETLVTFTGRLDPEKGIDTLLNAFAILKSRQPRVRLAIAGRGALLNVIRDHIGRLDLQESVSLVGYLQGSVLASFYKVSDIHVCPSLYEPFGLVVLEAMLAGTPVVVSNTGGLRDIVEGPQVGRLVPPRDHVALADALIALVKEPAIRRSLGIAAQLRVRQQFDWRRIAATAVSLLENIMSRESAAFA